MSKNSQVIMISGSSFGSGKDTFGEIIKQDFESVGQKVLHINFGDAVKFLAEKIGWNGDKNSPEGRYFLQNFATDKMRAQFPSYWADIVSKFCYIEKDDYDIFLITDLRFPNEFLSMATWFTDICTIKVCRPSEGEENRGHISEHSLEDFEYDFVVENKGSLEELAESAHFISDVIMVHECDS